MAMTPEGKVVKRIKKDLEELENCYHITKEALSLRGIPDLLGCMDGRFFALEVKKSAKCIHEPRAKLQEWVMRKIRAVGGFAEFIYPENYDEVMNKLKEHCNG